MKNQNLIICVVLTVVSVLIAIFAAQSAGKSKNELNQERYNRMVAEEKLDKMLSKVKTLEADAANTQEKVKGTQTVLEEQRSTVSSLQSELEKVRKLNEKLEQDLRSTIAVQPQENPPAEKP